MIGADLWNEPSGPLVTWGSNVTTAWNLAAQRIGNAILYESPEWLIFVEGTGWGWNLSSVVQYPVVLSIPQQLVYSPHVYVNDACAENYVYDSESYLRYNTKMFGFIAEDNIAPVYIGEFGSSCITSPGGNAFIRDIMSYMQLLGISWTFYSFVDNMDATSTFMGLLKSDYHTMDYYLLSQINQSLAASLI